MSQTQITEYFKIVKNISKEGDKNIIKEELYSVPPKLTIASPLKLNYDELMERISSGPPKLTPIKNLTIHSPIQSTPPQSPVVIGGERVNQSPSVKKLGESSPRISVVRKLFDGPSDDKDTQESKKIPAYQKFNYLVTKNEGLGTENDKYSIGLPLPYKYNVLLELFRSIETVSSILHNKNENITLTKLKRGVYELMKTPKLQLDHLYQIIKVYPQSYKLTRDDTTNDVIIHPISSTMVGDIIIQRRKTFHKNLIELCIQHHNKFLSSLKPRLEIPDDKILTRWHPKFQLDEVPDILSSSSSQDISQSNNPDYSARHLYSNRTKCSIVEAQNKLLDMAKTNPKLQMKLKEMMNKPIKFPTSPRKQPDRHSEGIPRIGSLKQFFKIKNKMIEKNRNISTSLAITSKSLLEKIRVHEEEKCIHDMTITEAETRRKQMLERLPDYIRTVRNAMVLEKKGSLPSNLLIDRVSHSLEIKNKKEAEDHIRLLNEVSGNWLEILKTTKGEFIKINMNTDINHILQNIQDLINKSH